MKRMFCMILLVLLLACVPTPEEDVVPQKDTVAMLEMAKSTPLPDESTVGVDQTSGEGQPVSLPSIRERYAIPETYRTSAELAEGHFILNVDAEVLVPDVSAIPIVRIERDCFDPAFIRALFQNLCGDAELYYLNRTYTKSQIADRIKYLSEKISDEQAYIKEYGEEDLAYTKSEIEQLKANYADAPDSVEDVRCYGELCPMADNYLTSDGNKPVSRETTVMGITAYTKTMDRRFIVKNAEPDSPAGKRAFGTYLMYGTNKSYPDRVFYFRVPKSFRNDAYAPEKAEADVNAILNENGLADFAVSMILYAPQQVEEHPDDPVYRVHCVRTVRSVKTAFNTDMTADPEDMFGPAWGYENMSFWMTRDGIVNFEWHAPVKVCDTVVENATLLPFEKIMERYLWIVNTKYAADMNLKNPDLKYGATTKNRYDIDRIELTLQRIQEPNEWDSALLVPVWNFYGVNTRTEVEDYKEYEIVEYCCNSMISINAIDGSIIDPRKGY